ncbi:MAG: amidohydrolase family protein [Deltaproteobacteria bacterium]|nr:amidohydrolase family protein [Deltaproteobacteria bacterium]
MTGLLIKNGLVADGTGKKVFAGHVLVNKGRIEEVIEKGQSLPVADSVIDAHGMVVAPGFIDMHSHSDWVVPLKDHEIALKCLLEQGVTTIVGGNCGFTPAPITEKTRRLIDLYHFNLMVDRPLSYEWNGLDEFFKHVENTRPLVNTAHLMGHASIRFAMADTRRGPMKKDEHTACIDELKKCLDQGACGVSFGLGYDPGMYSPKEEIETFCRVAASRNKPATVHIKALSRISPTYPPTYVKPHNIRALREIIDIAEKAEVRLQVSHLVFVGKRSWSTAQASVRIIEEARKRGLDVMFDAFPYTMGNTTVNAVLPYWFLEKLPQWYTNPWARTLLRAELAAGFFLLGFGYRDFQLMDAGCEKWAHLNGMRIPGIASSWGCSQFEALLRLSAESNGSALVLLHTYSGEPGNEAALESVLSSNLCLFETDALIRFSGYPNPAAMGTFPKILGRYVREKNLFSLENAVKRMTSESARRFGLRDRGVIAKGKCADIVIFDPKTIRDNPGQGKNPSVGPEGIVHVFVNGVQAVKNGAYMPGVRVGEVLRV